MTQSNETAEFFFNFSADKNGIVSLEFQKNAPLVLQSIVALCEQVNNSFDTPLANLYEFFKVLADASRKIEEVRNDEDGGKD